jgi:hypothetical protein
MNACCTQLVVRTSALSTFQLEEFQREALVVTRPHRLKWNQITQHNAVAHAMS